MDKRITITGIDIGISLRSISKLDIENLRLWRNKNRQKLSFSEFISEREQQEWFEKYLADPNSYLFMVEKTPYDSLGCMGFRLAHDMAEYWNLMVNPDATDPKAMGNASRLMESYIFTEHTTSIGGYVLSSNEAVALWHVQYSCAKIIRQEEGRIYLTLDTDKFIPQRYCKIEL